VTKLADKFLIFGGLHPVEYHEKYEWTSNLKIIEEKLNTTFEVVSYNELEQEFNALTVSELEEAKAIAEQLINEASEHHAARELTLDAVKKATKLYVAMKKLIDKHQAFGLTILCQPWIQGVDNPTPCIALQLFQEQGIPAACASDIDALMTMYLFKQVSAFSSYMGNSLEVCGHIGVSHCVLSRRIGGSNAPPLPYYISDYHGRKAIPTIHTMLPKGQLVTLARLKRNLEELILTSGQIVENLDLNGRCRNTLIIQVKAKSKVMKHIDCPQQHFVVAFGDLVEPVTKLADEKGIRVTTV